MVINVDLFEKLNPHVGHKIVCVTYGGDEGEHPENVAIECEDCGAVLLDYDCQRPTTKVEGLKEP
ncbi:MAG: hypothetical protein M0036_00095 [Desulfobacteraceae bacterium]|nr:hypothetical protein [Desulfobacteraceae bacterium]